MSSRSTSTPNPQRKANRTQTPSDPSRDTRSARPDTDAPLKEPADASALESLGAAISQPMRDAAAAGPRGRRR